MTRTKQILLVDSAFYARVQLDDDLAPYGFQVTSVKKIQSGLAKLKAQVFQAVVVAYDDDVEMPLRLLATLRQSSNQVPVLVTAKQPTERQLMQLVRFKPVKVMVKPYSLIDMIQRLDGLIENSATAKKA